MKWSRMLICKCFSLLPKSQGKIAKSHFWGIVAVLTWSVTTKSAVLSQIATKSLHIYGVKSRTKCSTRRFVLSLRCFFVSLRCFVPSSRPQIFFISPFPRVTWCLFTTKITVTCNCFHAWLLPVIDGQKRTHGSLMLHLYHLNGTTDRRLRTSDIFHDGMVAESPPNSRGCCFEVRKV